MRTGQRPKIERESFLDSFDFALGGAVRVVGVDMDQRVDDIFVRIDKQLFDLFGDIVGILQRHLVIDHDVHIHMQVTAHITGTEPMQADDLWVRKRQTAQFSKDIRFSTVIYELSKPRRRNLNCRMHHEKRNDKRTDGVRKPQLRKQNCKNNSHKHRNRAKGVATVVPCVRFEHLATDFSSGISRIAEENLFHDNGSKSHHGNRGFRMRSLARQKRNNRLISNPDTHCGNGKTNTNRNYGLESAVPVRVFGIRRRIPKVAANNHGDIGHKIRRTVNSVGNERLGITNNTHDKLCHREGGVPAKPNPSHPADFGAIVFFAYTSHTC